MESGLLLAEGEARPPALAEVRGQASPCPLWSCQVLAPVAPLTSPLLQTEGLVTSSVMLP